MADSNDIQDDRFEPKDEITSSTPEDANMVADAEVSDASESPEVGVDGAVADDGSGAPTAVEQNPPTEEELAARESEAALLLIFQSTVFDTHGSKIGRVGQVYLDDQTQEPNWITVKTGLFGAKEYFVPLDEADAVEKRITVPYDKETVLGAPFTEIDQNLSPEEEDELYNYYEVPGHMTSDAPLVEDVEDEPKRNAEPETIAPLSTSSSDDVEDTPITAGGLLDDGSTQRGNAAAADAPEHDDSDALSFDAFVDKPDDAEGGSPFERPEGD